MRACAVTSFSPKGYEKYGKRFIETFLKFWPIDLHVFYEDKKPEIESKRITYRNLHDDPDLRVFMGDFAGLTLAQGVVTNEPKVDYRWQAVKFAKKVYAVTSPVKCDWWIWIDADVITKKKVTEAFLKKVCRPSYTASYLGRKDWHHSECGFVAYNMKKGGDLFLSDLRARYDTGEIFNEAEWHDSYIWDRVRESMSDYRFLNLSKGIGGTNPWPETVLGEYMTHFKGPQNK